MSTPAPDARERIVLGAIEDVRLYNDELSDKEIVEVLQDAPRSH